MIVGRGRVVRAWPQGVEVDVPGWPGHGPGQFAMLRPDPDLRDGDPLLPRPMAIYRGDGERLEFRFHVVGRGTARLAALPAGSRLGVLGPLGRGFPRPTGPAILVGGGTGIASLFELSKQRREPLRVLLGGSTADQILGLEDFRALGVDLAVATEDGSSGHAGLVTDLLEPKPGREVFACGPTAMMRRVHEIARAAGSRCLVSLENTMACGFGVCLGCAVSTPGGFRYVCTDGPVFDADLVDWERLH